MLAKPRPMLVDEGCDAFLPFLTLSDLNHSRTQLRKGIIVCASQTPTSEVANVARSLAFRFGSPLLLGIQDILEEREAVGKLRS